MRMQFRSYVVRVFGVEFWDYRYVGEGSLHAELIGPGMQFTGASPLVRERAAWWRFLGYKLLCWVPPSWQGIKS